MHDNEIEEELKALVKWERCFSVQEVLNFTDLNVDSKFLQNTILSDSRFIPLYLDSTGDSLFISKPALFRWFIGLNLRLSEIKQFVLSERYLILTMSQLCMEGVLKQIPLEAVKWAQSFGLIALRCTPGEYVFPLAHVLSLMPFHFVKIIGNIGREFSNDELSEIYFKEILGKAIENGFLQFDKKTVDIVQRREGFLTEKCTSLEEISNCYGVTRQRILQIEMSFRYKLLTRPDFFLIAFLCDFMRESGSLVVELNSSKYYLRKFLAQCGYLPCTKLTKMGLLVLGIEENFFNVVKKINKDWKKNIDLFYVANYLESTGKIFLSDTDLNNISRKIIDMHRNRLSKTQKMYLTLCAIGKPAHYLEIAKQYRERFSDLEASDRSIHGVLTREEHGIVWVGVRGVFALKEWGYQHPRKPLFDTVANIVREVYKKTGRPVSYSVIIAEIGKYRKLVNKASLFFTLHFNTKVECVSKDLFIPRKEKKKKLDKEDFCPDELDKILQEFQSGIE